MNPSTRFYAVTFISFAAGLLAFGFIFGIVIHEVSHAIACLCLNIPIKSISMTGVSYTPSANPTANLIAGAAGGIGQAVLSLLVYMYLTKLETKVLPSFSASSRRSILKAGIVFGSELALLPFALLGVVTAVWEGGFFLNYTQYNNSLVMAPIFVVCFLFSYYVISKRFATALTQSDPMC